MGEMKALDALSAELLRVLADKGALEDEIFALKSDIAALQEANTRLTEQLARYRSTQPDIDSEEGKLQRAAAWGNRVFGRGNWIRHQCPSVDGKWATHHKRFHVDGGNGIDIIRGG